MDKNTEKRITISEDEYKKLISARFIETCKLVQIICRTITKLAIGLFIPFMMYLTITSVIKNPVENIGAVGNIITNTISSFTAQCNINNKTAYLLCLFFSQ